MQQICCRHILEKLKKVQKVWIMLRYTSMNDNCDILKWNTDIVLILGYTYDNIMGNNPAPL